MSYKFGLAALICDQICSGLSKVQIELDIKKGIFLKNDYPKVS